MFDPKLVEWERATSQWPCDGYTNNAPCYAKVSWKDPRDNALYCHAHKQAVDQYGAEGRSIIKRGRF